jgi:hypothetical protein
MSDFTNPTTFFTARDFAVSNAVRLEKTTGEMSLNRELYNYCEEIMAIYNSSFAYTTPITPTSSTGSTISTASSDERGPPATVSNALRYMYIFSNHRAVVREQNLWRIRRVRERMSGNVTARDMIEDQSPGAPFLVEAAPIEDGTMAYSIKVDDDEEVRFVAAFQIPAVDEGEGMDVWEGMTQDHASYGMSCEDSEVGEEKDGGEDVIIVYSSSVGEEEPQIIRELVTEGDAESQVTGGLGEDEPNEYCREQEVIDLTMDEA